MIGIKCLCLTLVKPRVAQPNPLDLLFNLRAPLDAIRQCRYNLAMFSFIETRLFTKLVAIT